MTKLSLPKIFAVLNAVVLSAVFLLYKNGNFNSFLRNVHRKELNSHNGGAPIFNKDSLNLISGTDTVPSGYGDSITMIDTAKKNADSIDKIIGVDTGKLFFSSSKVLILSTGGAYLLPLNMFKINGAPIKIDCDMGLGEIYRKKDSIAKSMADSIAKNKSDSIALIKDNLNKKNKVGQAVLKIKENNSWIWVVAIVVTGGVAFVVNRFRKKRKSNFENNIS